MKEKAGGSSTVGSGIPRGISSFAETVVGGMTEGDGAAEGSFSTVATPFTLQLTQQANRSALESFDGLSPLQMVRLLYYPFDSPNLVTYPASLDHPPEAPLLRIFMLVAEAIGERGVKPTATGNLPRALCQEVAHAYLGDEEYRYLSSVSEIRSELEVADLHTARMVAEMAGLLRRYRGRLIVGRECRKMMADRGGSIYPRLFRTFAGDFNWGYGDSWAERPLIQQSFLFSLFLLKRHGGEWRSNRLYEDFFLGAFPRVVQDTVPRPGGSPEEAVRRCYFARCLNGFARLLGLVEIASVEWDYNEYRLRKLPLLDHAVHFHLRGLVDD